MRRTPCKGNKRGDQVIMTHHKGGAVELRRTKKRYRNAVKLAD